MALTKTERNAHSLSLFDDLKGLGGQEVVVYVRFDGKQRMYKGKVEVIGDDVVVGGVSINPKIMQISFCKEVV